MEMTSHDHVQPAGEIKMEGKMVLAYFCSNRLDFIPMPLLKSSRFRAADRIGQYYL